MAFALRFSSASRILAGLLTAAALAVSQWILTGSALESSAASPAGPAEPAVIECRWTDGPIRIDGKGDDAPWKTARAIDRFTLPGTGKGARAATKARLLWDRENLYFLAEMTDPDLHAAAGERVDAAWNGDVFVLSFKPAADDPGYYVFQVNPAGRMIKTFVPQRRDGERYQPDPEAHMEVTASLRGTLNRRQNVDGSWLVEGRIAWRDFLRVGGRPEIDERWTFALCRYDYRADAGQPELSSSAPLTQPSPNRYEDYATLRFVGPDAHTARPFGIERRIPLTTSRVTGSPDPPLPYTIRRVYPRLKLNSPVTIVHEPGSDRLLVVAHKTPGGASSILRFKDQPEIDSTETLLSLDRTAYNIAFHPDFDRNGYLYLSSKGPLSADRPGRKMQVARFTMSRRAPFALDPASEKVIIDWPSDGHDGGGIVFGNDGMLYITSGDGTGDSDTDLAGQDMTRLLAKLLRIDVDSPEPGKAYSVPKDNPFVGMNEVRPETWAFGFRNPWRMTADPQSGQIWVGNGGQDLWETVHLIQRGANYGWSVYEGSHPFYLTRKLGPAPHTPPTVEHSHSESRSLTGGVVYRGRRFPELQGAYIYGDYSTGKIWAVRHDGIRVLWQKEIADTALQVTGFGTDSQGEILIVDIRGQEDGGFYSLEPTPGEKFTAPNTFPTRLSQTGLFRSVPGHVPEPALISYTVNAPLWSDGAYKERYIALPGAQSQIDVTPNAGWNFPDGALLVKSFALERESGNPGSRRWIETRLLVKESGEWVGYSYLWNDAQTEATLVGAQGTDHEFAIREARSPEYPDGIRKQTWHYPSRAECMTCHSRAANYVLGLTTLQMNREHNYGKVRDNQLRVLEHLGTLRVNWVQNMKDALRAEGRARGMTDAQLEVYVREQTESRSRPQARVSSLLDLPPERYPRLADPYDQQQDLNLRARSYLHSNCAQCHVGAGGGNSQIQLEFTTTQTNMRAFDVPPLHDTFGIADARLIAPGSPERSVLLKRISHRDRGYMPPLATSVVDREAVELIRDWIRRAQADSGRSAGPQGTAP